MTTSQILRHPTPNLDPQYLKLGTIKKGNNGRNWMVIINPNTGFHMWRHRDLSFDKNRLPLFNIGDTVEIIDSGIGCGHEAYGHKGVITKIGEYCPGMPGYFIEPTIGNCKSGSYNGLIGEDSFKLIYTEQERNELLLNTKKRQNMSKATKSAIKKAAHVRTINTSLINKDEVFRMLALAEATQLPVLLVGPPGTGKTKTVLEYAKAWLNKDGNMNAEDFANKIYILETDEGTKASEIKGMPDLGKLFTENVYDLNTPIAEAEIVIINEVDKASSAIRNAMLGVMNERFLFNGKHKIPCKWKLFVATCNEIPKEEVGSPFWDRFMLKTTVNRVSPGELSKYYNKGGRTYHESLSIGIPSKAEIDSITVPVPKLEKYLEVGYAKSSDRTLTFVPTLTKAVSYIWDSSIDKSLVKTAQIMIDQTAGSELQNKIMSPEVKAVMSKVDMLKSHSTNEQ